MLRSLALLTATLVVALPAVGCGEDDSDDFRKDYDAVSNRLSDLGERVQKGLQAAESKTDAQLARQFSGFADQLDEVQADLGELEPPSDAEDDVAKLEGAIADVEESLGEIADASRRSDPDAARTATLDLIQRGERVDRLQKQVEREVAAG